MSTSIRLDWLSADGTFAGVADSDGVTWHVEDIEGWWGSLGIRADTLERTMSDGDFPGRGPDLAAREVTITGWCRLPDPSLQMPVLQRLSGLLTGQTRWAVLTVDDGDTGATQAVVRLGGSTLISKVGDRRVSWSVQLYAPDPARYGSVLRSVSTGRAEPGGFWAVPMVWPLVVGPPGASGFVTATNDGEALSWPTVTFTGPLTNPALRMVGGPAITLLLDLAVGDQVVIDTRADTVVLNGTASRYWDLAADSQMWPLPTGDTAMFFTADAGAGTCTVQWRDAWT